MIEITAALLERHRQAVARMEQGEADDLFLDDVLALLDDIRLAGEVVTDPADRARLRSLIRFWGGIVYDYTGAYPTVTLLPADVDDGGDARSSTRPSAPPLLWLLVGGASVAVIAASLVVIGWVSQLSPSPRQIDAADTMALRVRQVAAEQVLGAGSAVPVESATFCRGAPEAVFHLSLDGYDPDMDLEWRLSREGTEVSARPAVPYGDGDAQGLTIRVGSGVPGGLVAGTYDLSLYSDSEPVWTQTFHVLSVGPRVSGLQVSDVPGAAGATAVDQGFAPGLRILFLRYRHEGLCSGVQLSHSLYRAGELIYAVEQVWSGDPAGEHELMFQSPDGAGFAPGDYEIAVSIAGTEQGRVAFRVLSEVGS